jgi:MFS family permease
VTLYAVVVATALLTMLDNTVVTVAAPSIAHDLAAPLPSLEWVANGYMLTYAGLLLGGGRLADRWGNRPVLLAGIAVFTGASAAAGLAREVSALIAARATSSGSRCPARPAASDAAVNSASPASSTRRMPYRSVSRPPASSRPAYGSM